MEKSGNSRLKTESVFLDTDVLVSWLIQETESVSGKELWKAPLELITLIQTKALKGFIGLTSLLEIRFLLRRKKKFSEASIASLLEECNKVFEVAIPDEVELLRANHLQEKYPLDPFDAILLSTALSEGETTLITRDKPLLRIASRLLEAKSPEDFLK